MMKGGKDMYAKRLIDERLKSLDEHEGYICEGLKHLKEKEERYIRDLQKIENERKELNLSKEKL